MRVRAIPVFEDIHILRRSMLKSLADYAFLGNQLLYKNYGNGIISGCELTTTRDSIQVDEGVIIYDGQIFLIKEPMQINYYPTNTTMVLKALFSEQIQDRSFTYREINLLLTGEIEKKNGEIELCRFKLQEGARLRYEYQDFEDQDTEFDTLNMIYADFSAYGGTTLSPYILRDFARELLGEEGVTEADRCVCLQILGQDRPMNREMLVAYVQGRNGKIMEDTSNHAIYSELLRILKEARQGKKNKPQEPERKKWRMTVE